MDVGGHVVIDAGVELVLLLEELSDRILHGQLDDRYGDGLGAVPLPDADSHVNSLGVDHLLGDILILKSLAELERRRKEHSLEAVTRPLAFEGHQTVHHLGRVVDSDLVRLAFGFALLVW